MDVNNCQYQWALDLYKLDGSHVGTKRIVPDWEPAFECAQFSALRRMPDDPLVLDGEAGYVEPCFDPILGSPYVTGFRVVTSRAGFPMVFDIPLTYFQELAQAASADLVAAGELNPGERFHYVVFACQVDESIVSRNATVGGLTVREAGQTLDVEESPLDDFLGHSILQGPVAQDEFPVFVPRDVVDEAVECMRAAGAVETGGILIGRLRRDRKRPELFAEVTAQIPAEYAQHDLTRLTFTPNTWAAADRAIRLRAKEEIYVGWWHSHPASHWKKEGSNTKTAKTAYQGDVDANLSNESSRSDAEVGILAEPLQSTERSAATLETFGRRPRQRKETGAERIETVSKPVIGREGDFFSVHDVLVHRTVFPRAYSIALVLSDGGGQGQDLCISMFGWHSGVLTARGFYLLGAAAGRAVSVRPTSIGG